jgi:hypothetical protein
MANSNNDENIAIKIDNSRSKIKEIDMIERSRSIDKRIHTPSPFYEFNSFNR